MVAARDGIKLGMKVAKNLYKGYKLGKRSKALPTMTKVAQKSAKRALTRVGVAAKRSKATSKMAFNPFKSSATKSKAFKKSLKSSKSAVSSLKKASKQTNAVKALNKANQKVLQGSGGKAAKLGRSVGASSTKSKIVLMDSSLALSIKPHVLITTMSPRCSWTTSLPFALSCPINTSLS